MLINCNCVCVTFLAWWLWSFWDGRPAIITLCFLSLHEMSLFPEYRRKGLTTHIYVMDSYTKTAIVNVVFLSQSYTLSCTSIDGRSKFQTASQLMEICKFSRNISFCSISNI
jgi:hypothetical protein